MEQSKQEVQNYQEDEIDLRAFAYSLFEKKFLIAGLTAFVTVLAILYALNLSPTYRASSSFISPSSLSITTINKLNLTAETKDSVFSKFLNNLSSKELQKIVFLEGGFVTLFNPDNSPIDDVDAFISGVTASVRINAPRVTKKEQNLGFLTELPYSVTMEGVNAETISEYLNTLVALANSETIIGLIKHNELKISNRLDEISLERNSLMELAEKVRFSTIERIKEEDGQKIRQINDQIVAFKIKAKQDRLNQIERIKEEDGQKIRQINDQIDRIRLKAKENRLNKIVVLTDAAKLAKSLGVIENNLNIYKDINAVSIAISESNNLPDWYLYGEKALLQRIKLLKNRISDDPFISELVTLNNQLNEVQNNNALKTLEARQDDGPFIPEIATLNNQLNEVQNNNALKTLETRQDDSPFIAEIAELEVEKIKLQSRKVGMNGVNAMKVSQISIPAKSPIKPNKRMIVLVAFIGSFMMSVFLVLVMGALKPDEENSA